MTDSFGDGWSLNSRLLISIGEEVIETLSLASGSSGSAQFTVFEPTVAPTEEPSSLPEEYCGENKVYVDFIRTTMIDGQEESFKVYMGDSVAGEAFYTQKAYYDYEVDTQRVCLEEAIYTIQLTDSYGDGWFPGSNLQIKIGGRLIDTFTLTSGSSLDTLPLVFTIGMSTYTNSTSDLPDNHPLFINNDNDCTKISQYEWSSITVRNGVCNQITSSISITNNPNLTFIVVGSDSFQNVASLTVENCTGLNEIEIGRNSMINAGSLVLKSSIILVD